MFLTFLSHFSLSLADKLGRDEEIGRTVIDLEDRFFGKSWQEKEKKPLEVAILIYSSSSSLDPHHPHPILTILTNPHPTLT